MRRNAMAAVARSYISSITQFTALTLFTHRVSSITLLCLKTLFFKILPSVRISSRVNPCILYF